MAEIIVLFIVFGIYGLFRAWLDGDFKTAKDGLKSEISKSNQNQQLNKEKVSKNIYLFVKLKKTEEIIKLTKEEWNEILLQNNQFLYDVLYDFNEDDYEKTNSEERAKLIDSEVSKLDEEQYNRALKVLKDNKNKLEKLANDNKHEKLEINNQKKSFNELNSNTPNEEIKSETKYILSKEEAILKLKKQKELLDLEIISQKEYDKIKSELKPIIIN